MNMVNDSTDAGAAIDLALAQFVCMLIRAGIEIKMSHLDPDAIKFLGAPHVKAQSEFAQQILDILRARCDIEIHPLKNAFGGVTEGEIILQRKDIPLRSPQEEFQAFRNGFATGSQFHSRFGLFAPEKLLERMRFWHHHFARAK